MALTEQRLADLVAVITRLLPILNDMPLLGADEMGVELLTGKVKIGDGSTPWASLPYLTASGGSGALLSASHDFTAAELNALDVTPITLIASPGPGFMITPVQVITRNQGGAVSYDEGTMSLFYGVEAGAQVAGGGSYPASGVDTVTTKNAIQQSDLAIADVEDQAIIAVNDATDPSTGDGTMSVTIYYVITAV